MKIKCRLIIVCDSLSEGLSFMIRRKRRTAIVKTKMLTELVIVPTIPLVIEKVRLVFIMTAESVF